jgi:hypothetical protein
MTVRSFFGVAGLSVATAIAALGTISPASAQVQAVPRQGVSFSNTITVRAKVEAIDTDTRTIAFSTADGGLLDVALAGNVTNLDAIPDGSMADITYNEVVMLLNLRQKGPGAQEARKDASKPDAADVGAGRFTMTVVAVDLAANKVSVIDGRGGEVRTYAATSIAKQDMLKKIKVGDVVIGLTTPLTVTAVTPVK